MNKFCILDSVWSCGSTEGALSTFAFFPAATIVQRTIMVSLRLTKLATVNRQQRTVDDNHLAAYTQADDYPPPAMTVEM